MDVIFILIPLALVLLVLIIWGFMWAVKSGQFEDMEGPAYKILLNDDAEMEPMANTQSTFHTFLCKFCGKRTDVVSKVCQHCGQKRPDPRQ